MKNIALSKGYEALRRKGANCPECGAVLHLPARVPAENDVIQCSACSWSGGPFDFISSDDDWGAVKQQPAGSKIVKSETADGVRWLMPAAKRLNFLCVFAFLWLSFISFFTAMVLFGEVEDDMSRWAVSLFLVPFWAVGLGVGYAGLRMMLLESILLVNSGEVQLMQKLFGKVKVKELSRAEVKRVERYTAYSQNDRPVYGLRIVTGGKEKLDFGSRLNEDEKRWLLSELKELLVSRKERKVANMSSASGYGGAMQLSSYADLQEIQEKGLELNRVGNSGFRIEREHLSGKWFMLGGLIAAAVSVFLFSRAMEMFDDMGRDFDFFELISLLFELVPFIIGLGFGVAALGAFAAARHFWGLIEQFEFSNDELVVKKGKRGHRMKETRYPKDVFHSGTSRESGSVNNEPRYSVSVKGRSKRVGIVSFVKRDTADQLLGWLDVWFGH
ncbi:hypothetical protein ACFPK9_05960 [Rubritalea spongiae]|uniref:DUF2244 domain-containing protein n=1 Tax=Rubritalea spongiae TaxID=430797 RepID=A0ABW5E5G8_9BACT